ncbi:MAG: DUF1987 domain-containing protein [Sulfuricella sp.]|nr:DUF1987 domain-containing protein [Sulfuricella sp.]
MEKIIVQAGDRTPYVEFDFPNGHFLMKGESYPEDAAAFFGPLLQSLRKFIDTLDGNALVMDMEMVYFNSSSAKALMNIFRLLEDAAQGGASVTINWRYHEDDDTMLESGEDFAEDFKKAAFNLLPMAV